MTAGSRQNKASELFACAAPQTYDVERIRADFPILNERVHGRPLAYLDSAASAQRPRQVLEAMTRFYERDYANIHRGVHELSLRATQKYEDARESVRRFLNAGAAEEIIFTRNATESINLVAASFGHAFFKPGDEVVVTELEHHANIVPWQLLERQIGIRVVPVRISDAGEVSAEDIAAACTGKTRMVAVAHVSNALGTILPVADIVRAAHARGVPVLADGAQAVPRMRVDVRALDCDFYVFTGHKLYGPTGIGVLYGKAEHLRRMPPYQGGGSMITEVSFAGTGFREPPFRFEAGTPPIAEAIGLAAAIDYISAIGIDRIAAHEDDLLRYAEDRLNDIAGLRIIGTAPEKAGIISFVLSGVHPHDVGTVLDQHGVAVRAGHHCAQPVMERYGIPATVRASFGMYSTRAEADALAAALRVAQDLFG
ncbi:MAG: SufS family cysteine desulfurase [Alphaproteobacteria bacterium]|nr:SufS family cysteine desulfurase [Alphaproteobacteria bacterium]